MRKYISENKNKLLILCTIISTIIYLVWRITATIPLGLGKASLISGIALLLVEIIGMFEAVIHFYNMSNIEYPKRPEVSEELFPDVDIFIATYNEPVKLLYKTSTLNVRFSPNGAIISTLNNGNVVNIVGQSGDFYKITFGKITGYASVKYISQLK